MKKLILCFCLIASSAMAEKYTYDVSAPHDETDDKYVHGRVVAEDASPYVDGYIFKNGERIKVHGNFNGYGMVEVAGVGRDKIYQKYELYIEE